MTSLLGTNSIVFGSAAGYSGGDLAFTANQWAGIFNCGEFGISGTMFTVDGSDDGTSYSAGDRGRGVAVSEAATGTGYLLHSNENLHTRFGGLNPFNADHFIAVRFEGGNWQYNNDDDDLIAAWIAFIPLATDTLVADIDFSADTVTSLLGTNSSINGIAAGYESGDLEFTANQWAGIPNPGEFGISGTMFTVHGRDDSTSFSAGDPGRGVAVHDGATGYGFILYSSTSVHSRFEDLNTYNAEHFIAVRQNGSQWQYNDNTSWIDFAPESSDVLVADVDFSNNTSANLHGIDAVIGGIAAGYIDGDLDVMADFWNGSFNEGEFGLQGTFFVQEDS